jgi:D-alanyl-D-alanine carboxypeptidase
MGWASTGARHGLRSCVLVVSALIAALAFTTHAADARHHRHVRYHFAGHAPRARHFAQAQGYSPPAASIVVDGNSGAALEQSDADAARHPASLTKVMTLYLLFERLDAGKISLDTPLEVSARAAEEAPTKLGLKPGQTISAEDAIKGVVTRSANDAAVVIAENLGGSEEAFARLMTQKARALGMSHTNYVNASGLPDDDQVTTARDQALLGRAIQDRFPRYYRFFSTTSFVFRGTTIRGHNHLLGSVRGVDGIKTGFTNASGFNLLTSVHRDGRYLVGVVLGGRSAFERDGHMRALIESNIRVASARRGALVIAEQGAPMSAPQPAASAKVLGKGTAKELPKEPAKAIAQVPAPMRADPAPTASANQRATVGSSDPIRPVLVKTITYRTVTARSPAMKPMPVLVPTSEPAPPVAVQSAADAQSRPTASEMPRAVVASAEPMPAAAPVPPQAETGRIEAAEAHPVKSTPADMATQAPAHLHGGWVIQIGAFDGEGEARQHLSEAKLKVHATLAAADPFTERVQKGDTTLFRARFAGFDKTTAEAACRQLKRSDFACMALKD